MHLSVSIDGTPYPEVKLESIVIEEQLEGRTTKASFDVPITISAEDLPGTMAEVVITNEGTSATEFRGFLTTVAQSQRSYDLQVWSIACVGVGDYLLKNIIVNDTWTGTSDAAIIAEVFGDLLPDFNMTHVSGIATGIDFEAKDITLEELLNNLSNLSGADWWVTHDKELYYVVPGAIPAPFGFSDNPSNP